MIEKQFIIDFLEMCGVENTSIEVKGNYRIVISGKGMREDLYEEIRDLLPMGSIIQMEELL